MKKLFRGLFLVFWIGSGLSATIFGRDAADEDSLFKDLADTLSKVEKKLPNKTVAVYGFEVIGRPKDSYGLFATEKLTHQLVSNGALLVVERSRIDQVLKEQSLAMTGIMDSGTAAKIGQILSVDAVIIGTIHVTEKEVEFFARVIQSEKGIILASADKKLAVNSNNEASGEEENKAAGMKPVQPLKPVEAIKPIKSSEQPAVEKVKTIDVELKLPKSNFKANESITISYSGMPGNNNDWITLTRASDPDSSYGDWFYTSGQKSGTYSFKPVEPGDYEVRVYFDWPAGGYMVQKRIKISVK